MSRLSSSSCGRYMYVHLRDGWKQLVVGIRPTCRARYRRGMLRKSRARNRCAETASDRQSKRTGTATRNGSRSRVDIAGTRSRWYRPRRRRYNNERAARISYARK
uniref:Uncharacterized protein n=1 Tax=Sipha flava TaxID=143950 RepID=A0A2S2QH10_9HEMI